MHNKKAFYKSMISIFIFFSLFGLVFGVKSDINDLILFLSEEDIIITEDVGTKGSYEGYDYKNKVNYRILADDNGRITDFTVESMDTTYDKLDFSKIQGLKWFTNHYLESNREFFKTIKENIQNTTYHQTGEIDLGEWKVTLLVFPLQGGKMDISLHLTDDASTDKKQNLNNTLSNLKNIYSALGCIEIKNSKMQTGQMSYRLPYYKINPDESLYYNAFVNHNNKIYKTQFIYYKNGVDFSYKDIPQIKQIIGSTMGQQNYPFDKLNVQFNHLKDQIMDEKTAIKTSRSSWSHYNNKTIMDVEHYETRNQIRVKITVYLAK